MVAIGHARQPWGPRRPSCVVLAGPGPAASCWPVPPCLGRGRPDEECDDLAGRGSARIERLHGRLPAGVCNGVRRPERRDPVPQAGCACAVRITILGVASGHGNCPLVHAGRSPAQRRWPVQDSTGSALAVCSSGAMPCGCRGRPSRVMARAEPGQPGRHPGGQDAGRRVLIRPPALGWPAGRHAAASPPASANPTGTWPGCPARARG